ncbi:2-isopropylmalate synthase [Synchytrium endobioticum]|uniref:2-isopropylmalate synthase n=1 Tax=Synchytrium endobioticum TaxID=286115 RepID=A0A507C431_9FUNG|nr:2-isopropylmalate synthase [Synchytrium endobioticum]
MMAIKEKIIIFDTSLRDGEQSPGVTLTASEKVEIARALSRLGVDVCEAGFPIASQGDFDAVQCIAREVGPVTVGRKSGKPMVICGLARAVPADIKRAYEAVKDAPLHRVHTFLATSDIHLEHKLRINREECIQRAVAAVTYAKSLGCTDIEFSPEDAGRSDRQFLCQVLGEVIKAGATTLNIPDTVGYNIPEEYGAMIKHLVDNTPGGRSVIWSTHCHDDLGLAAANTLAGVQNGARQVEVTINGIGERAGNTSLEEVVMAIHCKPTFFPVESNIDTTMIYSTSQLVTKRTGMVIQPNKAVVGANAFAHESGIHQDGMLKNRSTYEIMEPATLGIPTNHLVLGKHSGRAAFKFRIEQVLGYEGFSERFKDPAAMDELFVRFKKLADTKRRGVTDQDLYALLDDLVMSSNRETYKIKSSQVFSGSGVLATATVSILDYSNNATTPVERMDAAMGHGPVHAIFRCINRLTGCNNVLASYEVKAVTEGSDSLGQVLDGSFATNHASRYETTFQGQGTDEDILLASAKAYLNAINKLVDFRARKVKGIASDVAKKRKVDVIGGQVDAIPRRQVDV